MFQGTGYCEGCYCAKLTVNIEGSEPLVIISKMPPIVYTLGETYQAFTHSMTSPIEREYPYRITRIEGDGGQFYFGTPNAGTRVNCPLPGTYPVAAAGDVSRDDITDMYWDNDKLYCYFDKEGAYGNNVGSCNYKVFGMNLYSFRDGRGMLYQANPTRKLTFTIECDECCKEDEIICTSPNFPGYTCYQIPPAADRILKGKNEIVKYWKHDNR